MPYSVTPQNLEMVRNKTLEKINKYKDCEGFFGYYIYGEPDSKSGLTRNMREATLTIRE